ncbi:MAG TPA: hypothetical protein VFN71_12870 [Methylomirabilota bacterium]|nr:hypothetical protein [Methylomirabilota bacterium]
MVRAMPSQEGANLQEATGIGLGLVLGAALWGMVALGAFVVLN